MLEAQIVNLYSALCADRVVFNSAWNRDSFLAGVAGLLDKLPDQVPPGLPQKLLERSCLLPVGLDPVLFDSKRFGPGHKREIIGNRSGKDSLIISWAARWEYDKGPDRLLEILRALDAKGLDFRLNILGRSFRRVPEAFGTIRREFASRLLTYGYVGARESYMEILRGSDIILSTANHEFQGLAVLEGVACGCAPVVPDALVYPELFDSEHRYESIEACVALLVKRQSQISASRPGARDNTLAPDVSSYSWRQLAPRYEAIFEKLCKRGHAKGVRFTFFSTLRHLLTSGRSKGRPRKSKTTEM